MSAVFREMTCLRTNAALFCSEPACPGAAPLHFWLTLPSRACLALAGNKAQGYQGHCSQASCGAAGATAPRTQQLLNAGSFSRTGRMQAEFSLRESILQSHCHQNTHALKSGDRSGNVGAKDGQSDFRGHSTEGSCCLCSFSHSGETLLDHSNQQGGSSLLPGHTSSLKLLLLCICLGSTED